ncbi:toll/interleukin-1 receptor domain-containing protein [Halobacillus litoralis]|uniref:toll/interleukin-1 receptor domain-containing protein n=1 Tax=Halobacillus litoralis TaxID=45668 RepID=UPI001CD61149|nr:toll/interleukin-1 receptor domain-containing protein [Halobacillus litoralis]MCA1021805.1 toll/interleukin-1 receptor domain-containing protein [Halobacillus litoralis]
MDTRPKVFLSHSKKDHEIIEKIAMDLRKYKIDVWYDDWEINPGDSLRDRIFEDGIPNCDLFFVYLTDNSIDSNWVKRELDASLIQKSRNKGFNILTFVSSEEIRSKVPLDIASLNLAIINNEEYNHGFLKLVSSSYQNKLKSIIHDKNISHENEILKLENENQKLRTHVSNLNKSNETVEEVIEKLKDTQVNVDGDIKPILEIFKKLYAAFTSGVTIHRIGSIIEQDVGVFGFTNVDAERKTVDDFITPLYFNSIIELQRQTDELPAQYYLSEFGISLVKYLNEKNEW